MDYEQIEIEVAKVIAGEGDGWEEVPDEFQCQYREQAESILTALHGRGLLAELTGNVPWVDA